MKTKMSIYNENSRPKQYWTHIDILMAYQPAVNDMFANTLEKYITAFTIQNQFQNLNTYKTNNVNLRVADPKSRERVLDKLKESDVTGPSSILDYVRATISVTKVEDVLDLVNFLSSIDDSSFELVHINNGFNIAHVDQSLKEKYPILKSQANVKSSNYMDMKLYFKIPINDGYMVCETIVLLNEFDKKCKETHLLFEKDRLLNYDTMDKNEADAKLILEVIRRNIYLQVIDNYNEKISDGIQLAKKLSSKTKEVEFQKVTNNPKLLPYILGINTKGVR